MRPLLFECQDERDKGITKEELSHFTGKTDSGIFGVTDANLAKAILEEIDHSES